MLKPTQCKHALGIYMALTVWLQMPSSPEAHTVPRGRTPYPTRHVEQPIKAPPLLSVFSWQDEKTNKQPQKNYTEMQNLINAPLSWAPSTADKFVNPNHTISVDGGLLTNATRQDSSTSLRSSSMYIPVSSLSFRPSQEGKQAMP